MIWSEVVKLRKHLKKLLSMAMNCLKQTLTRQMDLALKLEMDKDLQECRAPISDRRASGQPIFLHGLPGQTRKNVTRVTISRRMMELAVRKQTCIVIRFTQRI